MASAKPSRHSLADALLEAGRAWWSTQRLLERPVRFHRSVDAPLIVKYRGLNPSKSIYNAISATLNASLWFHDLVLVFRDDGFFAPVTYTGVPGARFINPVFGHELEVYASRRIPVDAIEYVVAPAGVYSPSAATLLADAGIPVKRVKYPAGTAYDEAYRSGWCYAHLELSSMFRWYVHVKFSNGVETRAADLPAAAVAMYADMLLHGEYRDPVDVEVLSREPRYDQYMAFTGVKRVYNRIARVASLLTGERPHPETVARLTERVFRGLRGLFETLCDAAGGSKCSEAYEELLANLKQLLAVITREEWAAWSRSKQPSVEPVY